MGERLWSVYIYRNIIYMIYSLSSERPRMDTSDRSNMPWVLAVGKAEQHGLCLKGGLCRGLWRKNALQNRFSGVGGSPLRGPANKQPLLEECL